MEFSKDSRVLKAHVRKILDEVGNTCERWQAYQNTKRRVTDLLGEAESDGEQEEREAILFDYEITVIIAAYYMGVQDGFRQFSEMESGTFVQHVLNALYTEEGFRL